MNFRSAFRRTVFTVTTLFSFSILAMATQPGPGLPAQVTGTNQVLVRAVDPFAVDPLENGIPGARVVLIDLNTLVTDTLLTDIQGEALFAIDPNGSYEVKVLSGPIALPLKVSVHDLLILQKHLINIKSITQPELLIAADINGNCNVSVSDLIALRNVILDPDQLQALPWAFYPEDIQFFNQANPCAGNTGTSYIFDAVDYPGPDPATFIFEGYAKGNVSG
ncbi:MAG: hypothetical protein R2787_17090 [Saprospiraceae bacterium]